MVKEASLGCRWVPSSARFVVLGAYPKSTGSIQVFELESSDLKLLAQTEKSSSFKCGTFGASTVSQRHLATGDFNGNLAMWDIEHLESCLTEIEAHSGTIETIDGCGGKAGEYTPREIATGGRDGCVKVFDVRQKPVLVAAFEPSKTTKKRECWTVAFGNSYNDTERCLLAGYDNGDVKLFDLRTNKIRWEENANNGVCGVQFDRQDIEMNKFVVSCLESEFHVFDARTQHPQKGFAKHTHQTEFKSTCWAAFHLPQNRDVFSVTHGDGTVALFKYSYPQQRRLKGKDGHDMGIVGEVKQIAHSRTSDQPVTCFDWNSGMEGLFVCGSIDQKIRLGYVTKLNKL